MYDVKNNLAKNITELRTLNGMTQSELGEKLNYSDKTISKWERAESSPDISVLVEMADLFGVSLDQLVRAEKIEEPHELPAPAEPKYNRHAISYIAESVGWILAIFAFIVTTLILKRMSFQWLYLVYALPVTLIVKLVFNSLWFNTRRNYAIISALMWAVLLSVHVTFLYFKTDVSLIYLLGLAGQAVIILWSFISKPKK